MGQELDTWRQREAGTLCFSCFLHISSLHVPLRLTSRRGDLIALESSAGERKKKIGLFVGLFCLWTTCPSRLKSFIYGLIGEFRSSQVSATLAGGSTVRAKLTITTLSFLFFFCQDYTTMLISFGDVFVVIIFLFLAV